eukprot:TRINITY_DN49881_c0_g1_i1.p2 TRINITY_DN49881_c0_g1~~TRINITY_DN49881_c0_g1_i1.p2  ORF type:complete len:142 (-),score=16.25 TRINITY_DN49881_c0_g1_i1:274-699(-)
MEKTAIEITGGTTEWTSRLSLKKAMERFGEVVGCHIGNRGVDNPVVRFATKTEADAAHEALSKGEVLLDGQVLQGDWKSDKRRYISDGPRPGTENTRSDETKLEMTSRDFLLASRGGGRSRSRDRDRRRDRSRERTRRRRD